MEENPARVLEGVEDANEDYYFFLVNEESTNGFTWSYAEGIDGYDSEEFIYRTPSGEQCLFKYQVLGF